MLSDIAVEIYSCKRRHTNHPFRDRDSRFVRVGVTAGGWFPAIDGVAHDTESGKSCDV